MGQRKLYPVRLSRIDKILPALEQSFEIVDSGTNPVPRPIRDVWGVEQAGKFKKYAEPIMSARTTNEKPILVMNSVDEFSLIVGLLCEQNNVPFVVRPRGGMWKAFHDRAHTESFVRKKSYSLRKEVVRNRVLSLADGIIPVTDFVKMQILYELETDIDRIHSVHNTIETDRFDATPEGQFRDSIGLSDDTKFMLTITNFHYHRKYSGIVHFAPAIERVLHNHPEWHLVVAGSGKSFEQGRREIREQFAERFKDRIIFTGFYTPIEEALIDAEIALHLSFRDSAAMTVLEAQAARTPIIVNTAGGMSEMIDESLAETSVVISEIDQLHRSLKRFVESPERRRELGERNRGHIEREFSPEKIGEDFAVAIDDLLF